MSNLIPVTIMVTREESDLLVQVLEDSEDGMSDLEYICIAYAQGII